MKSCTKCNSLLPLSEFSPKKGRPGQKDGLKSHCKSCVRQTHREKYNKSSYRISQAELKKNQTSSSEEIGTKKCSICGLILAIGEFHKYCANATANWHYSSSCKTCSREKQKRYTRQSRPSSKSIEHILLESKRKGVSDNIFAHGAKNYTFDLNINDIRELINNQTYNGELICAATGIPLLTSFATVMDSPLCPSIDRIDNAIGYMPGNVRITSIMYNLAAGSNGIEIPKLPISRAELRKGLSRARSRARDRNHSVPSLDELEQIVKRDVNGDYMCATLCTYLGEHNTTSGPSLDRLDNGKGYDINNIQIVTKSFNIGKNKFPLHEAADTWRQIMDSLVKRRPNCFDDEWPTLRRLLTPAKHKIRPQKLTIRLEKNAELSQYHYIGISNAKYHITAYYGDKPVAYMSISNPTRQSQHDWEITRMIRHPEYFVYGLWSYILKWCISNLSLKGEIVSFSDNRLFDGNVYSEMGFQFFGHVKPDYYWYKNGRRHHKSKMRKNPQERQGELTENELRMSQGYSKIYDLGKKKWVKIIE